MDDQAFKLKFTNIMNDLVNAFPGINNKARMQFYYLAVRGLPLEAVQHIANNFLKSETRMPLPADFSKSASEWRKDYFMKNGFYYGEEASRNAPEVINCNLCFDTGIMKVQYHDDTKFVQLMRCSCDSGATCSASLPRWDNKLSGAYKKVALDESWFNPHIDSVDTEVVINNKIFSKVDKWKEAVKSSEIYWTKRSLQTKETA